MCLAVPGRIIALSEDPDMPFRMAEVDFCGLRRKICIESVEGATVGDYVVAHAGVAISVMDAVTAREILEDLESITRNRESSCL